MFLATFKIDEVGVNSQSGSAYGQISVEGNKITLQPGQLNTSSDTSGRTRRRSGEQPLDYNKLCRFVRYYLTKESFEKE